MPEWIRKFLPAPRLGRMFNSQDPSLEVNLLAYAFGILAAIVWLSRWAWHGPRDANFVAALGVFLTAVTGGLFKRGSSAQQQTTGAGAPDKDGGGS